MAEYALDPAGDQVVRTADGLIFTRDTHPAEWQTFVAWVQAGNVPDLPPGLAADAGRMFRARLQLEGGDFAAIRTAINNASSLAALRPILLAMLLLMWRIARANGLVVQQE
jgi:hypothetical protein